MKSLFVSKTFYLAMVQAGIGLLTAATSADTHLATVGWLAMAKSVLDILLRLVTNVPVTASLDGGK